jgi:hypothetical protein
MTQVAAWHHSGVTTPTWRTSTFCGSGACVAVAIGADTVRMRDDKHPAGPVLEFTRDAFRAFIRGIKHGDYDRPQ